MIELENINIKYKNSSILQIDELKILEGEIAGITCKASSGKSSLLRLISGREKNFSGNLFIDGKALKHLSKKAISELVYFVPPFPDLNPEDTIFDSVIKGQLRFKKFLNPYSDLQKEMTSQVIHSMELSDFANERIKNLSDSIKKMSAIAQGLNSGCKVLALDSPELLLDFRQKIVLGRNLKKYAEQQGLSIIIASSDPEFLIKSCDKIIFLKDGRIFTSGHSEVIDDSLIKEVFGVQCLISKNIISALPEIHIIE